MTEAVPSLSRRTARSALLLAAGCLLVCLPALARDSGEIREVRESRDTRDTREAREARDVSDKAERRAAERDKRDTERSRSGDSGKTVSGDGGSRAAGSTATSGKSSGDGGGDGGGSSTDTAKAAADAKKDQERQREDGAKDAADAAEQAAKDAEDAAKDAADAAEDEAKDADRNRVDLVADDRIMSGQPMAIERGRDGRERITGEVLMIDRAEAVARVRAAGYTLRGERPLPARGEAMARVQLRAGQSVEQALQQLQTLAPQGVYAPNHVFRPSQVDPGRSAARPVGPAVRVPAAGAANSRQPFSVGIIDTGADLSAAPIAAAVSRSRSFVGDQYLPRGHGTLVAEIAAAGGARLALADVFGTDADKRLVAPADAIAAAIAWLIEERAAVINISIEGPDNPVMALMVRRAMDAGVIIVAAAGNGGPAAPPAFPAAYPGVIAVTAIDGRDRVYRRANRGAYIAFAAPGVNVVSSTGSFGGQPVSGTSFAAPAVSATIARDLQASGQPAVGAATVGGSRAALARLRAAARDLGPTGFDPVFGWGAVGVQPAAEPANKP